MNLCRRLFLESMPRIAFLRMFSGWRWSISCAVLCLSPPGYPVCHLYSLSFHLFPVKFTFWLLVWLVCWLVGCWFVWLVGWLVWRTRIDHACLMFDYAYLMFDVRMLNVGENEKK